MTPEFVHFPDLVAVVDRASAVKAIEEITEQGEGRAHHRENSHFMAFLNMLKELRDAKATGSGFSPARPAMDNPAAAVEHAYGANPNPIGNPVAARVAGLFDSAYSLMLRMLSWSFEFDSVGVEGQLKKFCSVAIDFMPRVLLPLGEGLMLMPAGAKYPGKTAGPGFGLTRHVMLPPNAPNAQRALPRANPGTRGHRDGVAETRVARSCEIWMQALAADFWSVSRVAARSPGRPLGRRKSSWP